MPVMNKKIMALQWIVIVARDSLHNADYKKAEDLLDDLDYLTGLEKRQDSDKLFGDYLKGMARKYPEITRSLEILSES